MNSLGSATCRYYGTPYPFEIYSSPTLNPMLILQHDYHAIDTINLKFGLQFSITHETSHNLVNISG